MGNHELYQGQGLVVGPNVVRVNLRWPDFKKYTDGTFKKLSPQYVDDGERYQVFAIDGNVAYTTVLVKNVDDYAGTFSTQAKKDEHDAERADFENFTKSRANRPVKPSTSDGKEIFLPNLFPGGVTLYYAGAGDDPTDGRGEGPRFNLSSDAVGDTDLVFHFTDWIYAAGGSVSFMGADLGDDISLKLYAPASTVTVNGGGTGNCNLSDGGGAFPAPILVVPAAGDGTHDVDLSTAVPVPAFEDGSGPTGFWDWSASSEGPGDVTPSLTPGAAKYHLFSAELDLARFVAHEQLLGDGTFDITVPAVKPKKVLPHWRFKATLHNSGHLGLKVAWTIVCARRRTI